MMKRAVTAISMAVWMALFAIPTGVTGQNSRPLSSSETTSSGIGLIVLDPSGAAVPKARVIIADAQKEEIANGLTDRWGKFSVSQVPPGAYKLTVRFTGFRTHSSTLLVQEHAVAELSVTLPIEPTPDIVRHGDLVLALVVKDESGAVIPKAEITVTQKETGSRFDGKTNDAGTYRISDLAPGDYVVAAKAVGFIPVNAETHLADRDAQPTAITLSVTPTTSDSGGWIEEKLEASTSTSTLGSELLSEPAIPPVQATPPPHLKRHNHFKSFFTTLGAKLGF
jgi:hypothetical protein